MNIPVMPRARHGLPLATQLIIVMATTLLLVLITNVATVVWTAPPRLGDFVSISSIVARSEPLLRDIRAARPEERPRVAREASSDDMQFSVLSEPSVAVPESGPGTHIVAEVAESLQLPKGDVYLVFEGGPSRRGPGASSDDLVPLSPVFVVGMKAAPDLWIEARVSGGPNITLWLWRMAFFFVVSAFVLVGASLLFARRLALPLKRFALAAEELGRNPEASALSEEGPRELRMATGAFNLMRERLQRILQDRTLMLAAISHDLRTPIQRLRYRIEAVPDAERARFIADLEEIEMMIGATLAFARDSSTQVRREPLDLTALVEAVCADASDAGQAVQYQEAEERLVINADPVGLRRVISNLVENAVKYGIEARARVFVENGTAVVEVADKGPGIPATMLDAVFQPFRRLEDSRNRDTGGVGLGLSIARTIARSHGGDVVLSNDVAHGLRARLELPL